jgi:uncharacterized protein YhfF
MRHVVAQPKEARAKARRGAERARRDWTWDRAAAIAAERLRALIARGADPATASTANAASAASQELAQ